MRIIRTIETPETKFSQPETATSTEADQLETKRPQSSPLRPPSALEQKLTPPQNPKHVDELRYLLRQGQQHRSQDWEDKVLAACEKATGANLNAHRPTGCSDVAFSNSPFMQCRPMNLAMFDKTGSFPSTTVQGDKLRCEYRDDKCYEWTALSVPSKTDPQESLRTRFAVVSSVDFGPKSMNIMHLHVSLWCDERDPERQNLWRDNFGQGELVRQFPFPSPDQHVAVTYFDGETMVAKYGQATTVTLRNEQDTVFDAFFEPLSL